MPNKQRTFELVDTPKVHRPMTSKQAKKAYQKANRTPRITKAEQKRRDAEELAKHRKAYEKEQAAVKAKAARDKKAAKALEQKEERRKLGIPEPSRHVRASQSRISMFIKQGNKRLRETENDGEESEDTMCDYLNDEPPAKRVTHNNSRNEDKDEDVVLSKPISLCDSGSQEEPSMKHLAKNSFGVKELNLGKPIVPDDSEDEFGDFPPLSDNDISILDTSSMHSTPANALLTTGKPAGFKRSPVPSDDEPELPRMKNIEREQMSPDDPFEMENMIDSQIRSETADAACRSDCKQAGVFEEKQSARGATKSTVSNSNDRVKDMSAERELLWHTSVNGRYDSPVQFTHAKPSLALPQPSATKTSHVKQKSSDSNISLTRNRSNQPPNTGAGGISLKGPNSRTNSRLLNSNLPPAKKPLDIETTLSKDTVTPPTKALSRVTGLGKRFPHAGSVNSTVSKPQNVERYPSREASVQVAKPESDTRPALRERSINMGPPALPQKSKHVMPLAALTNATKTNDFDAPPSSTQAFIESHLDEFFPSPTQEARELREEPIIPRPSTSLNTDSLHRSWHEKQGVIKGEISKEDDEEFGGMLSTQELRMFSQNWEVPGSPLQQGEGDGKGNTIESHKEMPEAPEDIQNLQCSQNSISSRQKLSGLGHVSKTNSPTMIESQLPSAPMSILGRHQSSTIEPQNHRTELPRTNTHQVDSEMELTPKPRRPPWFEEKLEDKYTRKKFFTEKPEDLEAAAFAEGRKAWDEIKEATSSNIHNFDDDLEHEVDGLLKAALEESKEWDEVYKAIIPTPTPRKSGEKGRIVMDSQGEGIGSQTPSRAMGKQVGESAFTNETRKFEKVASVASTDYGDGEISDWDEALEGL